MDRFCDTLISIPGEIKAIESGRADALNNGLKNAPHTAEAVISDEWDRPYPREQVAYPAPWTRDHKFWPPVGSHRQRLWGSEFGLFVCGNGGVHSINAFNTVDVMKKLAGVLTQGHTASLMNTYILKKPRSTVASQTKRYGVVKLTQDVHAHFFVSFVQSLPILPPKLAPRIHSTDGRRSLKTMPEGPDL